MKVTSYSFRSSYNVLSIFVLGTLLISMFAANTAFAAALTSTNVEPATLLAGATGTATVDFTTVGAIPLDGKIKVR